MAKFLRKGSKRVFRKRTVSKPKRTFKKRTNLIGKIRNVVKKTLKRTAETKKAYLEPTSANFNVPSSNNFPILPNIVGSSMWQLCPTISLGTDSQSRIGNKIQPRGLYVKGHIYGDWSNIVQNNSSFQTIYVRVLALSDKQAPVDSIAYSNFSSSYQVLLNKGATSTSWSLSDQTCLYRPINRDRFTVYYDKVFKLGMYSAAIGTANVDQINGIRRFSFKIPMKEAWKFDDTNSRPSNISMPNLVIGYCPADNRNITLGSTTSFIKCTYYTDFYYQDE